MPNLMGQLILYLIWGALYHGNGSQSGSVLMGVYQEMVR